MFTNVKKREDTNLDSVFNRLQVSTICKDAITGNMPVSLNSPIPTINDHYDARLNQAIGRKLNLTRKKRANKSVLKKAKLILPKPLSATHKPRSHTSHKNDADASSDDDVTNDVDLTVGEENVFDDDAEQASLSTAPTSCSTQYLQQGTNGQTSGETVDSSPDELASYFEQILFIPKPMSLMAQMMYA